MDRYKNLVLKISKIRSRGRMDCIACLLSAKCVLLYKLLCRVSLPFAQPPSFATTAPFPSFYFRIGIWSSVQKYHIIARFFFDYMDGQYTAIATATDSLLVRLGTFVCFTEAMIALSTFAYSTWLPTCLLLALMWSQRK
jgi:hypothetical protein